MQALATRDLFDQFRTRPEHQVKRVGQDDLATHALDTVRQDALDGRLRADGHEGGRIERAVSRRDPTQSRMASRAGALDIELKGG